MDEPTTIQTACNLRDPAAPLWPILRLIVVGTILMAFLVFGYYNKFSQQDWITWGAVVSALGGIDTIKHFVATGDVEKKKDA